MNIVEIVVGIFATLFMVALLAALYIGLWTLWRLSRAMDRQINPREVEDFERRYDETTERITRGARRTDSRVI